MSFELLLCGVLAAYGLSNFVFLPRLTKAWNANRRSTKVAKVGVLATVQFVRNTALVAALTYVSFALITLFLGLSFGNNASLLQWITAFADRVHTSLAKVSSLWSHWFFVLPLILLAYLCWRTQRNDMEARFERLVDDEMDRLNRERSNDPRRWNELAPDEEMRAIDAQIEQAQQQFSSLSPDSSANLGMGPNDDRAMERSARAQI